MSNPFDAYLNPPPPPTPEGKRRRSSRRGRRRREAEPQTIGTNPPTWPVPDPDPDHDADDNGGFTGTWNEWTDDQPAAADPRRDDVDWNDWATATATEQSGDRFEMPPLPQLKDFGGGGQIARRPRKSYDDERYDDPRRTKAAAAIKGVLGAVVFAVVLGVAADIFLGDKPVAAKQGPGDPTPTSGSIATTPRPLPPHALAECDTFRTSTITISAERGDTASPEGAILGFEYSYYVDRDAARARTYVTDNAHVGDETALAAGISTYPVDVKYCVTITRARADDPDLWNISIEQQLDADTTKAETLRFAIRTSEVSPGHYKLTSIDYR